MLEMAILETQIFKYFWGPSPLQSRAPTRNITRPAIQQPCHLCYNDQFTPSGQEVYIGATDSCFKAVHTCMLVLILPTPEGWKAV